MEKLQKLAQVAVSVGNVERSVALGLIDMLDSGSAAQMEQGKIAAQVGHMHSLSTNVSVSNVQLSRATT